jgi:tRNA wybutosine-synthesizing protein 3
MKEIDNFLNLKERALIKLNNAENENKIDEDISNILRIINSKDDYFTSSSCSGRILIIELPSLGNKKEAKFLGKWHRKIKYSEIDNALNLATKGMIWILAQSPIFHVITKSNSSADKFIKIAIYSGFKNSGFKSYYDNIVIEILSTERLDAPIGKDGKLYCNKEHIKLLTDISNNIIIRSKKKLVKLERNLIEKL